MKIVVLDGYTLNPGDISWSGLEALGEVTVYDRTKADEIVERIGDADAVYTNKTPISRETLDACPNVKFIGAFNKLVIDRGPEAIDQEFERLMPVIRQGGYVPGADHQVAPSASFENYQYYLKKLREAMKQAGANRRK